MTRRFWIIAALALPTLALAASASWHLWRLSNATEWRIPVTGYDPRDLLAGHYVRFRYAWKLEGGAFCAGNDCVFCLEDKSGTVVARIAPRVDRCANRVDPAASGIGVIWNTGGPEGEPVASGQLYIPERDATRITRLLGQGKAVLVARLGKGDRLVAERIEPVF